MTSDTWQGLKQWSSFVYKWSELFNSLKYAIEETTFLECLIEQLPKLYYIDRQELRIEHVMFDHSLFKEGLYNMEIFIIKIIKSFLKAVNPTDVCMYKGTES